MLREHRYKFERDAPRRTRRDVGSGNEANKMSARLGLSEELRTGTAGLAQLLREYTVQVHLNIEWYQQALESKLRERRRYVVFSVLLLLALPFVVLEIQSYKSSWLQPSTVVAQLTALLTSLLAFQRTLGAWLDSSKIAGRWSQTSAKLKALVWDFHRKWDGAVTAATVDDFAEALRDGISAARQLTDDEQTFFYQNMTYPQIDAGAVLKAGFSDAQSIMASHRLAPVAGPSDQQRELAVATALVSELERLAQTLEDDHRTANAQGNEELAARLMGELGSVRTELANARVARAQAAAALAAPSR